MSCSAMETHATKLPVHSFCTEVNPRGDLVCVSQTVCHFVLLTVNCGLCRRVFSNKCAAGNDQVCRGRLSGST